VPQARGATKYVGKNATTVLNHNGKVITSWARNSGGFRGQQTVQIRLASDAISTEFSMTGLRSDDEPNMRGLQLEKLLDHINDIRSTRESCSALDWPKTPLEMSELNLKNLFP
jgi:hypothetical protein